MSMKRYLLIILSALFIFMSGDLYAQRRNPAKNADLAFGSTFFVFSTICSCEEKFVVLLSDNKITLVAFTK